MQIYLLDKKPNIITHHQDTIPVSPFKVCNILEVVLGTYKYDFLEEFISVHGAFSPVHVVHQASHNLHHRLLGHLKNK